MKNVYFYALIVWVLFVLLAVINGLVRNEYYPSEFGELLKHQISSVLYILVLLLVMYFFFNGFGAVYNKKDLWVIGAIWVFMTVIFEFLFGHYVMGHEMSFLYADYNIFNGRLWSLVLIFTFIGPRLVAKI